jgi:Na+-transporting methylmalonyl-CoA/oxaloacetate decarboxylase gamma subunit
MSATLSEILHWWNLMFLVPIALAVLLLLISATTGMGDGDAEADTSSGHTEADADADSDTDHGPSLSDALRSFGVGVVPVSLLTQAFLLFFGVWGLSANRFFRVAEQPEGRVWLALLVALVVGAVTTALFGAVMRRFFPDEEPATGGKDLVARSGRVIFEITDTGGTVQVRDAGGTLHQLAARVGPGADPIPAGRAVLMVAQDKESGHFLVEESPFSE